MQSLKKGNFYGLADAMPDNFLQAVHKCMAAIPKTLFSVCYYVAERKNVLSAEK